MSIQDPLIPPPPVVAPPRPSRLWLWLTLGLVGVLVLAAGTTAVLVVATRWDGRATKGDVAFTLKVRRSDGGAPSATDLDRTRTVLLARMRALKLSRPTVAAQGTDAVLVTVAPSDADRAKAVLVPAELTFRKVLQTVPDTPPPGTRPCATGSGTADPAAARASMKQKLGPAYDTAMQIADPTQADPKALTLFSTLTCAEVQALPPQLQFMVPNVTCASLNLRAPGALDEVSDAVVACDRAGNTKYALDVAKVRGGDMASAKAVDDPQMGGWTVTIRFTPQGQGKWTALTQDAMNNAQPGQGNNGEVAIVLDDGVITAPQIQQVVVGDAVISGGTGIDQDTATELAAELNSGALPVTFTIESITAVH